MTDPVEYRRSELITFYGATDGTNTSGTFTLNSPAISGTVTQIKLDKGLKAKIWAELVSGAAVKVYIEYSLDGGANWSRLAAIDLASEGTVSLEKRRPYVFEFRSGNELLRFTWEQGTAAVSHVAFDIEVEPVD